MIRRRRRNWPNTPAFSGKILFPERLKVLAFVVGGIFLLIIGRLFQLQVVQGGDFTAKIQNQVSTETELTAERGDILAKDSKTGELVKLALNTSFNELRIDSQEIPDKQLVADTLAPLVFQEEDYQACRDDHDLCPEGTVIIPEPRVDEETGELILDEPQVLSFAEALEKRKQEIFQKINTANRYVLIKRRLSPEISERIEKIKKESASEHKRDRLRLFSEKKDVKLAQPDYFKGVLLVPKQVRYYPEGSLAAQIIGFINHDGIGQYGVEGKEKALLAGKRGLFFGKTDTLGRSIELSVEDFQKAVDGSDVVLTIDRLVQRKVEDLLSEAVTKYKADSGQVIVMNPKNGFILAMANYPTFDPNAFGDVYLIRRTTPDDTVRIHKTTPLFKKNTLDPEGGYVPATFDEYEQGWRLQYDPEFYVYDNFWGPGVYVNKTVQQIYEPGSIFKPLVMSIGINENEITPSTKYFEDEPKLVDVGGKLVPIRNADKKYLGWQTMLDVLKRSANLGMVFVAQTIGKGVMYENLKNFGFGMETFVELEEEQSGKLDHYSKWSIAQTLNTAFGQGISVTPLQMITAWCALANGGLKPKPHIIAEIHHPDGSIEKTEPDFTSVLKADTAQTITSMLVQVINFSYSRRAYIPGYKVAGKTGTSQIARTDGVGYEDTSKEGSTITGFVGYAPAENPSFIILVKLDRPRFGSADNIWGENTAAPLFRQIAEWMLDYYDIPPDAPVLP